MRYTISLLISLFITLSAISQTPVILDTDIDSDVDDVAALAMILNLHNAGTIKLLGVIVTSDDPYAPLCTNAINQYFYNGDLPIAFDKNQKKLTNYSRYTKQISDSFPHQLTSYNDTYDPSTLYRKLLAQSTDTNVVIITIGHLSSLQALLKSNPDSISDLTGQGLADQKVARWICMGGMFPEGKEANFYRPDSSSTVYCVENWKRPLLFCGWETGNQLISGGIALKDASGPESPVYRGFRLYNNFAGRPSWDQLTVLMLLPEAQQYFDIINNGYCKVDVDGTNHWITGEPSNQAYLRLKPRADRAKIVKLINEMCERRN